MDNKGQSRVRVGVGVFLTSPEHPGCILIGKRKGSSGSGTYALPGGHLEFSEEWHDCASRETLEETGLCITNISFGTVVNSVLKEQDYHYVTIFMKAEVDRKSPLTEPVNKEPEKCEGWFWCEWHSSSFPSPLFDPLRKTRQQGYDPFKDDMCGHKNSSLFKKMCNKLNDGKLQI